MTARRRGSADSDPSPCPDALCQRSRASAYAVEGRSKKTVPDVTGISWSRRRPKVVFPHPLSPTRASVSPRRTNRSTPSTVLTCAIVRRRMPPFTGKYLRRPSAATRMSFSACGAGCTGPSLLIQEACDAPPRTLPQEPRLLGLAAVERILAPGMEATSRRRVSEVRHRPRDCGQRNSDRDLLVQGDD